MMVVKGKQVLLVVTRPLGAGVAKSGAILERVVVSQAIGNCCRINR